MMAELHRLVGGLSGPANILLSEPESGPHPRPAQQENASECSRDRPRSQSRPTVALQMYKVERVFVDTRKRKRRTSLEGAVRSALEAYFLKCPKPNTQEITHISDDLGLERDVRTGAAGPPLLPRRFFCDRVSFSRWCAFGSATAGRRGSAWRCRWTRTARASSTSRAPPH